MSVKNKKEKENNFEKIKKYILEKVKKNIFSKYRKTFLILSSSIGIFLSIFFILSIDIMSLEKIQYQGIFVNLLNVIIKSERIIIGLFFIFLALPTSFYLWYLRNHDKLDSIEEQRKTNNFNSFSNAIKLFLEKDNKEANAIGLKLLMELKHKGLFEKQIDLMTQYKTYGDMNLSRADLSGANLQEAILSEIDLSRSNLLRAELIKKNLNGIKLIIEKEKFRENEKIGVNFLNRDFRMIKNYISVVINEKNGEYFLTENKTKK